MVYARPFIIDLGTSSIRVGHAGEALPKFKVHPVIGLPITNTLNPCTNISNLNNDFGTKKLCLEHAFYPLSPRIKKDRIDPLYVFYHESEGPKDPGVFKADFQALEKLIEDIASTRGVDENLTESNVLLVEPTITPYKFREEMLAMFTETLQVASVYFGRRAPLSCYANASVTATVVDIGAACTSVCPVVEGYANPDYVLEYPVGGDLIDRAINALLNNHSLRVRPPYAVSEQSGKLEYVSLPFITPSYYHWSVMCETSLLKHQLLLPDGNVFEPDTGELISSMIDYVLLNHKAENDPDLTFEKIMDIKLAQPKTYKFQEYAENVDSQSSTLDKAHDIYFESDYTLAEYLEGYSLSSLIRSALEKSAIKSNRIVLSGGSTIHKGFTDKFKGLLSGIREDLECIAIGGEEQQYSSFIGGSILSSLGGYEPLCLTKAEVSEQGVHRALSKKCP